MSIRVATWNVLHMVHEFNYSFKKSRVIPRYPNEEERIQKIYEFIRDKISDDLVVCLQEVPGDLIPLLSNIKTHTGFVFVHNRIPKLRENIDIAEMTNKLVRTDIISFYNDPNEYLVTLIPKDYEINREYTIQYDTKGKGALINIFNNRTMVVNTHMTINQTGIDDIVKVYNDYVRDFVNEHNDNEAYILGDMNNRCADVLKSLKGVRVIYTKHADLGNKPTYPQGNTSIDHILYFKKQDNTASKGLNFDVFDVDCLSDHQFVMTL